MKRNRSIRTLIATVTLIAGSAMALAHNGVEHVLGTVKTMTETSITVETVKHEISVVALDAATTFSNKGAKASVKDLKVGDRVAINAKDDANEKLHAISVKWGATPAAAAKGQAHKMDPKMKM